MALPTEGEEFLVFDETEHTATTGGFEFDFVDELSPGQKCSICLLAMRNPVQTARCGHRFCESCLLALFSDDSDPECPQDRQPIPENGGWFRDHAWERDILSLRVKCSQSERGCDWIGQIRHYSEHFEVCQCEDAKCEKCGQLIQRSFLDSHTTSECPNRIVKCEYCEKEIESWLTEIHESDECTRFPQDCPQECGVEKIPREELQSHLQKDCLMTIVECPYKEAGCSLRDKRSNLKAHLKASKEEHLQKVWFKGLEVKERLNELEDVEDDIGELQMERLWMKGRLNQLELSNSSKIGELRAMKEKFTNELENLKKQNEESKEKKMYMEEMLERQSEEIYRALRMSEERREDRNMAMMGQIEHLQRRFENRQETLTNKVQEMSRVVQNLYSNFQAMLEKQQLSPTSQLMPQRPNRKQFSTTRNPETTKEAVAFDPDSEVKKRKIKEAEFKKSKSRKMDDIAGDRQPEKSMFKERSQQPKRRPIKEQLLLTQDGSADEDLLL